MRSGPGRLLLILAAFTAIGTGAFGQAATTPKAGVVTDALPKHPIPYKAFKQKSAKPKPKVKAPPSSNAAPPTAGAPVAVKPPASGAALAPKTPAVKTSAPVKQSAAAPVKPPQNGPVSTKSVAPSATVATPATPGPTAAPPPPPRPAPVQAAPPPQLAAPTPGARLQPGQALSGPELEAFVDGQVSRAMASDHIAGVAVAVVQNGQLVLEKGFGGSAPGPSQRIDPRNDLVRLGSGSQIFTWIAVLKAVENGKLKLDAPVDAYLPEELKLPDEGFERPILLRHLMSHTAGFEDRAFGRRYVHDTGQLLTLDKALAAYRPRRVRDAGLLSIPSDYGVALAGRIVAGAEGHPFDQLIEGEIVKPLALSHTSFREPYPAGDNLPDPLSQSLSGRFASGFRWTDQGLQAQAFAFGQSLAPALSASTTADDMARLMIALLNNGRMGEVSLFNAPTAVLLRSPLQRPAPGMDGWAHGLAIQRTSSGFQLLSDVGAAPAFQSNLTLIPGLNAGVFVVANTDTGAALARGLASAIVERFYGVAAPMPVPVVAPADAYVGTYLSAKRAYHGLEAFAGRLTRQSALSANATGGLVLSGQGETQVFYPTEAAGRFRSATGLQFFAPMMKGKAGAYILGSGVGAAQRVGGFHSLGVLEFWAAATALTVFASFAGLFIRDRLDPRASRAQVAANVTQIVTCVVWCLAFVAFALFAEGGLSPEKLMFDWPNRWLILASGSALAAGILSLLMVTQLPGAWREERRIHGWSIWRKLRHTTTVGVFLVFTGVLAAWGALEPWSS